MTNDEAQSGATELDQVRARFLAAEGELREATEALRRLQSVSEQLAAARGTLGESAASLATMQGALASGAATLAKGASDLQEAVRAIDAADPARLRLELKAQHDALVGSVTTAQSEYVGRLAQLRAEMEATLSTLRQEVGGVRGAADAVATGVRESTATLLQRMDDQAKTARAALDGGFDVAQRSAEQRGAALTALQQALRAQGDAAAQRAREAQAAFEAARKEQRVLSGVLIVLGAATLVMLILK